MSDPDFHKAFVLDRDTGRLFWRAPPSNHAEKVGCEAGYICMGKGKNKSYCQVRLDGKTFKRSRVIFFMTHRRWPEPIVDHINGDSLDDRPSNLREADRAQNAWNMKLRSGKKSGLPKGVSHYHGQYRAQVIVRGKRIVVGQFKTPAEADAACINKRREVFGEYA